MCGQSKFIMQEIPSLRFQTKPKGPHHFQNLSLGIVCENIRHSQDFPHKVFNGKLRPPITPRTITKPKNLSNSCIAELHSKLGLQFVLALSATAHLCMLLSIASSKRILSDDTGLLKKTRLVAHDVEPGRHLRVLCDCRRPWEALETAIFRPWFHCYLE